MEMKDKSLKLLVRTYLQHAYVAGRNGTKNEWMDDLASDFIAEKRVVDLVNRPDSMNTQSSNGCEACKENCVRLYGFDCDCPCHQISDYDALIEVSHSDGFTGVSNSKTSSNGCKGHKMPINADNDVLTTFENCKYCKPSSNGCCDVKDCVKTETHTHSFQATGDRMLLVPEGMSYNGEHGPVVVREPSHEEWEAWVRTLAGSKNPKDIDLLVAKIHVLLTADRERVRGLVEEYREGQRVAMEQEKNEGLRQAHHQQVLASENILALLSTEEITK